MGDDKSVLMTEYRTAKHTLEHQIDSVQDIGDHATRMLRIVLLLLVGLGTAIAYSDIRLTEKVFDERICAIGQSPVCIRADHLAYLGAVLLFLGIFLLISSTLGVGTKIERPFGTDDGNKTPRYPASETWYLMDRISMYEEKVEFNRQVLEANRLAVFLADISISLGFAVLSVLIVVLGTTRHLLWWTPLVVGLLAAILVVAIRTKFPENHPYHVPIPDRIARLWSSTEETTGTKPK